MLKKLKKFGLELGFNITLKTDVNIVDLFSSSNPDNGICLPEQDSPVLESLWFLVPSSSECPECCRELQTYMPDDLRFQAGAAANKTN